MEKKGCYTKNQSVQEKLKEHQLEEAFQLSNAASVTDCTGAVPAAPKTKDQYNNYEESYHFLQPPVEKGNE